MEHDTKFYKFIEYVSVNRAKVLFGIALLAFMGVLYTAFDQREVLLNYWIENKQQETVNDFQFRQVVKLSSLIQTRLDGLRDNTGAKRIVVRRFHNGRQDLTTVPFEKVTDVYTSHAADFELLVDTDRTLPMSAITGSLNRMWGTNASEPTCFGMAAKDFSDPSLRRYLVNHNIEYSYVCPITNIARYPLGLIASNYHFVPSDEQLASIEVRMKGAADSIGGYLDMMADVKRGRVMVSE